MTRFLIALAVLTIRPANLHAGGLPLLDGTGTSHGAVVLNLARGQVVLKVTSLAPLPATVNSGSATFTATSYKAYLFSSADSAVEVFLADVYPNAKQRATRRVSLGGDVSHMSFDRVAVTAFSSDGQSSFDVLTASF